jgi:hypothetical protein
MSGPVERGSPANRVRRSAEERSMSVNTPAQVNWLWVTIGNAATDIAGKILAIIFPITAFVALGFDHVVANMFFRPAALFVHAGGVSVGDTVLKLAFAFIGHTAGAGVFVAGAYYYMYLRARPRTDYDAEARAKAPTAYARGR